MNCRRRLAEALRTMMRRRPMEGAVEEWSEPGAAERWDNFCSIQSTPIEQLTRACDRGRAVEVRMPLAVWRALERHPELVELADRAARLEVKVGQLRLDWAGSREVTVALLERHLGAAVVIDDEAKHVRIGYADRAPYEFRSVLSDSRW